MLSSLAALVVALAGFYFLALGVLAFTAPARVSGFLMGFASSASTHYLELVVRVIVGAACILTAQVVPLSVVFACFGRVLVGTTAVLFLVPWKVHRRFAEVTLGQGKPLFPRRLTNPPLALVSVRQVGSGFAELRYEVPRGQPGER